MSSSASPTPSFPGVISTYSSPSVTLWSSAR
nr:MAG TPA: hypothetical protein [Caudoviricetes sp.]